MGGTSWPSINLPDNLLTLCGSGTTQCHGWVESHPEWAELHGWSVRRWQRGNVDLVPVWTWRRWVLLSMDGELHPQPNHPGVTGCDCGCRPTETPAGVWSTPVLTEET